jgi:hypothetical protein
MAMDQPNLMTPEEMEDRLSKKEDPFSLVIDKWERLARFLYQAFTLEDFNIFLVGCQVTIPFCHIYGTKNECHRCPVLEICQGSEEQEESMWSGLYRLIQAYGWAGDFLPPEPLRQYVHKFLETLKSLRQASRGPRTPRRTGTNPAS